MQKFKEDSVCPKCEHESVGVRYCPGDETVELDFIGTRSPNLQVCYLEQKGEHLHRSCSRCQYEWAEGVLGE